MSVSWRKMEGTPSVLQEHNAPRQDHVVQPFREWPSNISTAREWVEKPGPRTDGHSRYRSDWDLDRPTSCKTRFQYNEMELSAEKCSQLDLDMFSDPHSDSNRLQLNPKFTLPMSTRDLYFYTSIVIANPCWTSEISANLINSVSFRRLWRNIPEIRVFTGSKQFDKFCMPEWKDGDDLR